MTPVMTPNQESTFIHFYLAKPFTSGLPVTHTLTRVCLTVMLKPGLKTSLQFEEPWQGSPLLLHPFCITLPQQTKWRGLQKKPDWNAQNAVTSKGVLNRWTERKFLQPDYKLWALGLRSSRGWACFSRAENTDRADPEHTPCLFFPSFCSWQSLLEAGTEVCALEAGTEVCAVRKRRKELKEHSCCNIPSPGVSSRSWNSNSLGKAPRREQPLTASPHLRHWHHWATCSFSDFI